MRAFDRIRKATRGVAQARAGQPDTPKWTTKAQRWNGSYADLLSIGASPANIYLQDPSTGKILMLDNYDPIV